jgi:hypothetical protein
MIHERYIEVGADGEEPLPDLDDPVAIGHAGTLALAVALARRWFREPEATVGRLNAIRQTAAGSQPRAEGERLRRRLAEAWQLLEHARYVCRDVDREQLWFLTGDGAEILSGTAPVATLRDRLTRPH